MFRNSHCGAMGLAESLQHQNADFILGPGNWVKRIQNCPVNCKCCKALKKKKKKKKERKKEKKKKRFWEFTLLRAHCYLCEDAGLIPGLAQWVKDPTLLQTVV